MQFKFVYLWHELITWNLRAAIQGVHSIVRPWFRPRMSAAHGRAASCETQAAGMLEPQLNVQYHRQCRPSGRCYWQLRHLWQCIDTYRLSTMDYLTPRRTICSHDRWVAGKQSQKEKALWIRIPPLWLQTNDLHTPVAIWHCAKFVMRNGVVEDDEAEWV